MRTQASNMVMSNPDLKTGASLVLHPVEQRRFCDAEITADFCSSRVAGLPNQRVFLICLFGHNRHLPICRFVIYISCSKCQDIGEKGSSTRCCTSSTSSRSTIPTSAPRSSSSFDLHPQRGAVVAHQDQGELAVITGSATFGDEDRRSGIFVIVIVAVLGPR